MAIKVGIIGAGGMLQYHAAGFRQAGAEIVAVADAAPGAAAKAANQAIHTNELFRGWDTALSNRRARLCGWSR